MRESRTYGSVRGARGNSRPLYVADCLANKHLLSSEENGEPLASLWRMSPCGRLGPVFQAPLLRLDGILGRALAQILRTRLFEAELLLKRRG